MKYSEAIEKLDSQDLRIFYKKFRLNMLIAIILALVLFPLSMTIQIFVYKLIFLCVAILVPSLLFRYGYYNFKKILSKNNKIVKKGEILNKREKSSGFDEYKVDEYYLLLRKEGWHLKETIQVRKKVYESFNVLDKIALHYLEGKAFCFHHEKIN